MNIDNDVDAWIKFPQHRKYFNKLWLSEKLGYLCGPGGVPVPKKDRYIVRPIYNLRGMGAGAEIITVDPNDLTAVPPGYFWCEVFDGNQYSLSYQFKHNNWTQLHCYRGINSKDNLYKFTKWIKSSNNFNIPSFVNELKDCEFINIETIEDKIIEIHLRLSPDPIFNELIPIWEGENYNVNYKRIDSIDDADGYLKQKRLGFFVK